MACTSILKKNKAFTLIELLIVIGIIAILAAAIIIAINPGRQFTAARDRTRESHLNSLRNAVLSYQVDNQNYPSNITTDYKEICNTNIESVVCGDLIDLSALKPNYISSLPVDPQGEIETNGTGYKVSLSGLSVVFDNPRLCGNPYIDPRDNNAYATVKIGNQCWTSKNMAYLPSVVGPATGNTTTSYYYVYDYNGTDVTAAKATSNYQTYGALYNWTASLTACPSGWHLPTDAEQHILENYLATGACDPGRSGLWDCAPAGTTMKASSPSWDGNNESGFTGLPAGLRFWDGNFYFLTTRADFWSSTSIDASNAWRRVLYLGFSTAGRSADNKGVGFPARCLRD